MLAWQVIEIDGTGISISLPRARDAHLAHQDGLGQSEVRIMPLDEEVAAKKLEELTALLPEDLREGVSVAAPMLELLPHGERMHTWHHPRLLGLCERVLMSLAVDPQGPASRRWSA